MTSLKIARHAKILELIEKYDIETQDELAQKLCEEGFMVTQATVSRDIREMKLTKIATERGKQEYDCHQDIGRYGHGSGSCAG